MTTLFISGIDTEVGKTIACGALANTLLARGNKVYTQKWVETGVPDSTTPISQDLAEHERIVGSKFNFADSALHAPYLFSYPASPHLSARLERKEIDCSYLKEQTLKLEQLCEHLLIEGAGGLCVPLNLKTLTIELVRDLNIPVVLVTSGKLGSLNHTLLSLDYCDRRNIEVRAVIFNHFPDNFQKISDSSREYLKNYVKQNNPTTAWLELDVNAVRFSLSNHLTRQLLR